MYKKNICIFIKMLEIGGAEKQSFLLAKTLKSLYNIHVVVLDDTIIETKYFNLKDDNISIYFLYGGIFKKLYNFYKYLKFNKIEIMFCYLASNNLWGTLIGKLAGVNWIIGGIRNEYIVKHKLFIQKILSNYFLNYTIFNSTTAFNKFTNQGFKIRKSLVIPNGIDKYQSANRITKSNDISIISVARFVPQKDFKTAINAIKYLIELAPKTMNIKYYIIGFGNETGIIYDQIDLLKLKSYIEVVIRPNDVNKFFKQADIYLCTSLYEGMSNSILESMSYSLPLVVTNVGDNDKLVLNGENGYLCKPKDAEEISKCLHRLCCSPKLRKKFGDMSLEILKQNYSYEKFQTNYVNFIKKLEGEVI